MLSKQEQQFISAIVDILTEFLEPLIKNHCSVCLREDETYSQVDLHQDVYYTPFCKESLAFHLKYFRHQILEKHSFVISQLNGKFNIKDEINIWKMLQHCLFDNDHDISEMYEKFYSLMIEKREDWWKAD